MPIRLPRLPSFRAAVPARAVARAPTLARSFANSTSRCAASGKATTSAPPVVGAPGASQTDVFTGEVTGHADIDVSGEAFRAPDETNGPRRWDAQRVERPRRGNVFEGYGC